MWLAIEKYVITERHSEIGQPTAAYLIRKHENEAAVMLRGMFTMHKCIY